VNIILQIHVAELWHQLSCIGHSLGYAI